MALAGALLLTAALYSALRADSVNGSWTQLAQGQPPPALVPQARSDFSAVYDSRRDRMVLLGGIPDRRADLWSRSLAPDSGWILEHPLGAIPDGRWGAMAVYDSLEDRMLMFGGFIYTDDVYELNDVWQLSLSGTPAWTQLSPAGGAPPGRQDGALIYDPIGNRLILFGGLLLGPGSENNGIYMNDVWQLSLTPPLTWIPMLPAGPGPSARGWAAFAYDPDRRSMIVSGGWDGTSNLGDTWELSLAGSGSWAPIVASGAPSPRKQSDVVYDAPNRRFVFFGGRTDGAFYGGGTESSFSGEVWQLTLDGTPAWAKLSPTGQIPTPRAGPGSCYDSERNRMVLFGGYDGDYRWDTEALSLTNPPDWSNLPYTGPIWGRTFNATVVRPETQEIYTFGGFGIQGDTNEIWRLAATSPLSQWSPVNPSGAPPRPRHGHGAVWDPVRQRLLTFGGIGVSLENDVWSFSPSPIPSWLQLTTLGSPPPPRFAFGIDYDPLRDRLIVVGGDGAQVQSQPNYYMNDVWTLPLSGSEALQWSQLSVAGLPPAPRWIFGMRYDPPRDRMVFYGGVTALGRSAETWALNLSPSPSWQLLPTVGPTPPPLSNQAMVYDPYLDRMIVFGGYSTTFSSQAWALNLASPSSWSLLSPAGALPVPRDAITAAFDIAGDRLLFMGGNDASNVYADTWALAFEPPLVAALASLISSTATPDGVRIEWMVPDASSMHFRAERSLNGGWAPIANPVPNGTDRVVLDDRSVPAGAHLTYRLWIRSSSGENLASQVSVDVPQGCRFALEGAHPNPASGDRLMIAFSLARAEAARLEVLDLAGRRVASQNLSGAGPGRHVIAVSPQRALDPGLYLVRLSSSSGTRAAKVAVIK
jgi:hypothetical protein